MSVCTFIAAGCELTKKEHPEYETFLEIDTKKGTIYDGDRDDDFALLNFKDVGEYTNLQYGVAIEWNYCTAGRAQQIIEYIKAVLTKCDQVQIWTVWLMEYYEHDERPRYKTREVSAEELQIEDIKEISEVDVWSDCKDRPTYYCLTVRK